MVKFNRLNRIWRSITGRMVTGVLMIHALLTPLLLYGILYVVEYSLQSQFIDQVRHDTYLYVSLLKPDVENNNFENQIQFLNEVMFNGDVKFAEIAAPDGSVIHADPFAGNLNTGFVEDFRFGANGDHVYYISAQLFSDVDGRLLGTLRLGYDELPTQDQIDSAYNYGLFLAASYIALSMLLVITSGRLFIRPILQLRNMATGIVAGDQTIDLSVHSSIDDIRLLARDLDSMRSTLLSKQQQAIYRENRLHTILDNAGEGIINIDGEGKIQTFNQAAETIFGYRSDEVLGKNVSMLMPSPHREKHDEYIGKYLKTGQAKIIGRGRRLMAKHRDGREIPIHLNLSVVREGELHLFTGMIRDLSREEEQETQLQQLWRAVDQSPVTVMITDVSGSIEYVNPCFCKVTGYQEPEVLGKNPRILKSDRTPKETYQQLWKTISNGGVWRGVFQNRKKNGEEFWVSSTICPVRDMEDKITHYISINEDITDVRKKERMLAQAMKLEAIGRMTDGIAHDFNNLLTVIRGNLRLLHIDRSDVEETEELINDALSAAENGATLIKRLLAFSRRQDQNLQITDVNSYLMNMERLLRRSVPDANIHMDLSSEDGYVLIDVIRLESTILNLVTNSRDAMQDGGNITISTKNEIMDRSKADAELAPGRYIALTVSDDGIGMNEQTRRQAIDPFFTTKSIETGTGLGLTMADDFAQSSGGKLEIQSVPGEGTSITILLPEAEQPDDWIDEHEPVIDLPEGNETILVVEDREKVRRFACRTLRRLGYRIHEASNAANALKELKNYKDIDLMFTDIVMPGKLNGRQLATIAIKKRPMLKILLTTGLEPLKDMDIEENDDKPLLPKPYTLEELAKSVRDILDR